MRLKKLKIRNLRNISDADLVFSKTINYLQGENGAGKTTVLEALYLLARSKSFIKGNQNAFIQRGTDQTSLFMSGEKNHGEPIRIGYQKDKQGSQIKINGEMIKKLSDLAKDFPIALITPQTHKILEEGPEYRRKLLNWGVFHVEHNYGLLISQYNRVLSQRNQALKENNNNLNIWDNQLVDFAEQIRQKHLKYLDGWRNCLADIETQTNILKSLTVSYSQGWDKEIQFKHALESKLHLDRKRGFTSVGPHRADLVFEIGGRTISSDLSRGQQKKLIILILIAQAIYIESTQGEMPVLLMDDFQSELDVSAQDEILTLVNRCGIQSIITGIQKLKFISEVESTGAKVFHVEQGRVSVISS